MHVDWIVAMLIFLTFSIWAFAFYYSLDPGYPMKSPAFLAEAGKIERFFSAEAFSVPAVFTAAGAASNATVWAYIGFDSDRERNSTRVYAGPQQLNCTVSGNKVFWEADLASGQNAFTLTYANMSVAKLCNSSIAGNEQNQSVLWAAESSRMFSSQKAQDLCQSINASYDSVKREMGVVSDFSVSLEGGGFSTTCGRTPPQQRDVFFFLFSRNAFEGGQMNMSVLVW